MARHQRRCRVSQPVQDQTKSFYTILDYFALFYTFTLSAARSTNNTWGNKSVQSGNAQNDKLQFKTTTENIYWVNLHAAAVLNKTLLSLFCKADCFLRKTLDKQPYNHTEQHRANECVSVTWVSRIQAWKLFVNGGMRTCSALGGSQCDRGK